MLGETCPLVEEEPFISRLRGGDITGSKSEKLLFIKGTIVDAVEDDEEAEAMGAGLTTLPIPTPSDLSLASTSVKLLFLSSSLANCSSSVSKSNALTLA